MMPGRVQEGKVKANPKMHKPGAPIRTIISGIDHPLRRWQKLQRVNWKNGSPTFHPTSKTPHTFRKRWKRRINVYEQIKF